MPPKKSSYSEKLKDPRWQKLRLKVLERDNWTCQQCRSKDKTLHVHHRLYVYGRQPWEYEIEELVTLCDECHEDAKICTDTFYAQMRRLFLPNQLATIADTLTQAAADGAPPLALFLGIVGLAETRGPRALKNLDRLKDLISDIYPVWRCDEDFAADKIELGQFYPSQWEDSLKEFQRDA